MLWIFSYLIFNSVKPIFAPSSLHRFSPSLRCFIWVAASRSLSNFFIDQIFGNSNVRVINSRSSWKHPNSSGETKEPVVTIVYNGIIVIICIKNNVLTFWEESELHSSLSIFIESGISIRPLISWVSSFSNSVCIIIKLSIVDSDWIEV